MTVETHVSPLEVARVEDLFGTKYAQPFRDWLNAHGVAPSRVRPAFVIVRDPQGTFEVHMQELIRDTSGKPQLDYLSSEPVTQPLVVRGLSKEDLPRVSGS